MTKVEMYVKRLETIQNMTDIPGVKELCELIMEILEDQDIKELGFKK
jgi:hypothetical protein